MGGKFGVDIISSNIAGKCLDFIMEFGEEAHAGIMELFNSVPKEGVVQKDSMSYDYKNGTDSISINGYLANLKNFGKDPNGQCDYVINEYVNIDHFAVRKYGQLPPEGSVGDPASKDFDPGTPNHLEICVASGEKFDTYGKEGLYLRVRIDGENVFEGKDLPASVLTCAYDYQNKMETKSVAIRYFAEKPAQTATAAEAERKGFIFFPYSGALSSRDKPTKDVTVVIGDVVAHQGNETKDGCQEVLIKLGLSAAIMIGASECRAIPVYDSAEN